MRSIIALGLLAALSPRVASAQGTVVETVHLVITGGANAGTFDAQGVRGGCTAGATGANSFGNQLSSATGDSKAFNSLQLIVPDAKAAAKGTKEFYVKVGFGPLMNRSAEYEVETRAGQAKQAGSGTVTVNDAGGTATVSFTAQTAAGVKLQGTIDCKKVMRLG